MGPEVPSRARRALPALHRSEKEDGHRPSKFLVPINTDIYKHSNTYPYIPIHTQAYPNIPIHTHTYSNIVFGGSSTVFSEGGSIVGSLAWTDGMMVI